jgi:protein-tyrosine-phosphatase
VLFLCTGNAVRSQMAEALVNAKGAGRFRAESAGSVPADCVHPRTIEALRRTGVVWQGHPPRSVRGLEGEAWDVVITVCARAKDACPVFLREPILAHWDVPAPVDVVGTDVVRDQAFQAALATITHRVDQLLALPIETLEPSALERHLRGIGIDARRRIAAR